jgi:hypothetical protein
MSFDAVFNGDPTTPNVSASGEAAFGIDLATGQLYYRNPQDQHVAGWQVAGGGSVTSDQVANESTVSGSSVTAALNTLSGSAGIVQRARVSFTAAQVKSLSASTTLPVIVAPGAGKFISVLAATLVYNFVTPAYTVPADTQWQLTYGAAGSAFNQILIQGFLDQSSSQINTNVVGVGEVVMNALTVLVNQPLVLSASGPVTAGNGTVDVLVTYTIETA